MDKILIIEDEQGLAEGLKDNFEAEGYSVSLAFDGEEGLQKATTELPDVIILDIMLPKKSGFDVCKELRKQGFHIPIIMLTARTQEVDRVLGLELGADDYVPKPFSTRELLARVKAILRRTKNSKEKSEAVVDLGKIKVDFEHYTAFDSENRPVDMTYKEFEILKYFIQNKGRTISRDELLDKVWGYEIYPTSRTVDNHIVKLRKKIEENPENPKHILTVYGIGYKYID
ncbi:MAG: response regulator transcription factor [candidate division KSB1 bacterium]|nr:response regulator transcription factor [candidate division KSB1 bacterium]MDZ7346045.1 response regulator transcription factor [candidate division KSB1 bacterium]